MKMVHHAGAVVPETAGVRVCGSCGRPVAARDRAEYTAARARLLLDRGFCLCPQPPAAAESLARASAPGI
ncbi:hypothetical protein MB27_03445 [Actinoplanes utahensis]|uniref:Uncharacterized protein n=1 Tax=Actinoplanes utahensis TaxID=1869 RepID=A0A0A6URE6_ACTUT|nr:hypothetical protein MB27_03445 [Actinoplanes utahensis]